MDVFTWTPVDKPEIDLSMIMHRLNVSLNHYLFKQKKRSFTSERQKTIAKEVDKLLQVGFIKDTTYPEWIANVIMMKKVNKKWWTYIDFTNLKKVCPKDSYPIRRIDQLIDVTSGHELLTFIDVFFDYNQI